MRSWGAAVRLLFVCVAALVALMSNSAFAAPPTTTLRTVGGVVDYAGIFQPEERKALEIAAGQLARRIDTDFFVVSIDDRSAMWADQRSHFAMVQKAYRDLAAAISRHFGRSAPVTLLLVFKSSVVLHLKTTDEGLQDHLLFSNFYGGARGALERIRHSGESYGRAASRYLNELDKTLDGISEKTAGGGLDARSERARFWLFQKFALLSSREVLQYPWLDPLYKVFFGVITAITGFLTGIFAMPGWIACLTIMGTLYLLLQVLDLALNHSFGFVAQERHYIIRSLARLFLGFAQYVLTRTVFLLPLFALFAVSQGDLENLLYITQNFGGELVTYLNWSLGIAEHTFTIPFVVITVGAIAVGLIAFLLGLSRLVEVVKTPVALMTRRERFQQILEVAGVGLWRCFEAVGWVMSLIIWPGLIAAFFLVTYVASWAFEVIKYFTKETDAATWTPSGAQAVASATSSGGTT